jgi:hypothetical protein
MPNLSPPVFFWKEYERIADHLEFQRYLIRRISAWGALNTDASFGLTDFSFYETRQPFLQEQGLVFDNSRLAVKSNSIQPTDIPRRYFTDDFNYAITRQGIVRVRF